ncbi:MAG: ferrochelatase [Hydrocarboniphaga sp.]|uniref:ferrochelatase n=1 Tax=Hydrocarboniphaga sp. TaxID=2033016 RepID=UPI002619D9C0|nr:ferrochelatase [Hydrocarboniphaga sp.]MDB5969436.1 ferrochelatase [Hydrocarboniphaga sp.]
MSAIDSIDRRHSVLATTGVLLLNLGTPEAPTPAAIRRYLKPFLSDRRVVELPRALWLTILYAFILPLRPRRLAHSYASIWMTPGPQGSPLLHHSQLQRDGLREWLAQELGQPVPVALGMTYGQPGIEGALAELEAQNVRRILVLPLYPQYSASSTGAALDAVFRALQTRRWMPEIRTINSYHDEAAWITALAQSLSDHWDTKGRAEHLLISFHSIPRQYFLDGDPYYCYCEKTARLIAEKLQLERNSWSVSYQSRLGNQPWLQPYTDLVIPQLARSGVHALDVICPGFSADCLETLEEVALRYRDDFINAGGRTFRYVPALNAAPAHIDALGRMISRHLTGWLPEADTDGAVRIARAKAAEAQMKSPTLLDRPA